MSYTIKAIQQQNQQRNNQSISYSGSNLTNYNNSIGRFDNEEPQQQQSIDKKDLNEINNRLNLYINTVNKKTQYLLSKKS